MHRSLLYTISCNPMRHCAKVGTNINILADQGNANMALVTTRTTGLQQVSHQAFHLRFSDLDQITLACKEDEETRSSRFIDWLGSRIARRAPKWVEDVKQQPILPNHSRTPWWDELRKCVEGDWVPSRSEGWNHPVASKSH